MIAFLGLLCLLYVADAAAIAPKAGLKRALPVSRSLSKVVPKKTSNDAKPPRSVSAKATVLGDGGYNTLTNMYGKVYDNVIFRQEHGFDPMGLAKGQPPAVLAKYRDAELLHGRMGMLAVAGILLAEKFHPVFPSASGTALQQWDEVNRLVPAFKWFALGHVIVNEAFRTPKFDITHRADRLWEDEEPGNYGWDPLRITPKDPEQLLARNNQEVNNGRLAMVAALGMLAEEAKTGQPIADKLFPNIPTNIPSL